MIELPQPPFGLADVAQRPVGDELHHRPHAERAGEIAELGVVAHGSTLVGVVSDNKHETSLQIRPRLKRRSELGDHALRLKAEDLDVQNSHLVLVETVLHLSTQCSVVDQPRSDPVCGMEAESDGVEPRGGGRIDLLQRIGVGNHEVGKRQDRHEMDILPARLTPPASRRYAHYCAKIDPTPGP